MAGFRRDLTPGGTYFFTLATSRRQPLLTQPAVIDALRRTLRRVRTRHPFETVAMVVLPDHLHAVWTLPTDDAGYSRRWGLVKREVGATARPLATAPLSASAAARRESGVWQRRFWEHRIRDEADLQRHVDYIHFNPVKHGYVARVGDWPYSTFHRYVCESLLPPDWGGDPNLAGEWGEP